MAVASCGTAQQAELVGSYVWQNDDPAFGGYSAIEVADDGGRFLALSDRAHLISGTMVREQGQIAAIADVSLTPLTAADGSTLPRRFSDSEGLAVGPDGTIHLTFEWEHGLRQLDVTTGRVGPFIAAPDYAGFQNNSGLEALAVDTAGTLYAVPERSGLATRPFAVFAYRDGNWRTAFEIPRRGAFLPTGADIGPDGYFYLLERDFVGIGFRSRVRRFDMQGGSEVTLLETPPLVRDNLEGISVWMAADGLRMTLISDDNFRSLQRTEIVEYRLTDR